MSSEIAEIFYRTLSVEIAKLIEETMGQRVKVSVYGRTIMIFFSDRIRTHPVTVKVDNITRKSDAEAIAKIYAQRVVEYLMQEE